MRVLLAAGADVGAKDDDGWRRSTVHKISKRFARAGVANGARRWLERKSSLAVSWRRGKPRKYYDRIMLVRSIAFMELAASDSWACHHSPCRRWKPTP